MEHALVELSLALVASALMGCVATFLRQPIIIAYILAGVLFGPSLLGWVHDVRFLEGLSHLGVTLLLFLAGLTLHPQKLLRSLKTCAWITGSSCFIFAVLAAGLAWLLGLRGPEVLVIGLAAMFSSTILVVKLLPTTQLHHARIGALCIGVLILQDLLAIGVMVWLRTSGVHGMTWEAWRQFFILNAYLAGFIVLLALFEVFVLRRLIGYVDRYHELVFILGLAWCFGLASLSHAMGLFFETGAFYAGVVLARHKISLFISERLKPLRDFFLLLFFFAMGAQLNLGMIQHLIAAALVLSGVFLVVKPLVFEFLLRRAGHTAAFAREAGLRLGQFSEFSLLVGWAALQSDVIEPIHGQLILLMMLVTFMVSAYLVVNRYPTPIGVQDSLLKD